MVLLCIPSQFGLVKFDWELSGLGWFGKIWFGMDKFGLVWLSSVWFDEVNFLKCSRSASQLSFTNLFPVDPYSFQSDNQNDLIVRQGLYVKRTSEKMKINGQILAA